MRYPQDFLTANQIAAKLRANFLSGSRKSLLVEGENGIGKTAVNHMLKVMPDFKEHLFVTFDCAQASTGDIRIPMPNKELGITQNMPNELFGLSLQNRLGVNGSRPVVLCLDELAKAPKPVLTALSPVFYDWRVGTLEFPEGSVIWATTNLAHEGLGDLMPAHTRNRITIVKMRKPTAEEWITNFAINNGISEEIIAWAHKEPRIFESFLEYESGGPKQGKKLEQDNEYIFNPKLPQTAYVSPRSLARASDSVKQAKNGLIDDETMKMCLVGDIGAAGAGALDAFIRFGRDIPAFEEVLKDPEGCRLSTNPAAQVLQVFQFVTRTEERKHADACTKYVLRMRDEMQSMFAHTVSRNKGKMSYYIAVKSFVTLLEKNRVYFAN